MNGFVTIVPVKRGILSWDVVICVFFLLSILFFHAFYGDQSVDAFYLFSYVVFFFVSLLLSFLIINRSLVSGAFCLAYILLFMVNPLLIGMGVVEYHGGAGVFVSTNLLVGFGYVAFVMGLAFFGSFFSKIRGKSVVYDKDIIFLAAKRLQYLTILGLLVFLILLFASGVNPLLIEKSARVQGGYISLMYALFVYFLLIAPISIFLMGLSGRVFSCRNLVFLIFIVVANFAIYRIRSFPVAIVLSFYLGFVCCNKKHVLTEGFKISGAVKYFSLVVMSVLLVVGVAILRSGFVTGFDSIDMEKSEIIVRRSIERTDLGYSFYVRQALERFPTYHPFLGGDSYFRVLYGVVPFLNDKPELTAYVFAGEVVDGVSDRVSVSPGVIGDAYINFGFWGGIFLMFLWGGFFNIIRPMSLRSMMVVSTMGMWLPYLVRGSFNNTLYLFFAALFVSMVIERVFLFGAIPKDDLGKDEL